MAYVLYPTSNVHGIGRYSLDYATNRCEVMKILAPVIDECRIVEDIVLSVDEWNEFDDFALEYVFGFDRYKMREVVGRIYDELGMTEEDITAYWACEI